MGLTAAQWSGAVERWRTMERVVLFDKAMEVLCRAVCAWAGVPLAESELRRRTADLAATIDAPAAVGWRYWKGRLLKGRECCSISTGPTTTSGVGSSRSGHRCPGEWITIALMKAATGWLTRTMDYAVPEQDLHIDRSRVPAVPRSGFVISDVRPSDAGRPANAPRSG